MFRRLDLVVVTQEPSIQAPVPNFEAENLDSESYGDRGTRSHYVRRGKIIMALSFGTQLQHRAFDLPTSGGYANLC